MNAQQLDIFEMLGVEPTDYPSTSVELATQQILTLIDGDPIHARDREIIVAAILDDAQQHGGRIDPNRVRAHLTDVYPRCIGATYNSLCKAGVIEVDGWSVNADTHGRNSGRPMRLYRRVS